MRSKPKCANLLWRLLCITMVMWTMAKYISKTVLTVEEYTEPIKQNQTELNLIPTSVSMWGSHRSYYKGKIIMQNDK